jgi:hypothetical protein
MSDLKIEQITKYHNLKIHKLKYLVEILESNNNLLKTYKNILSKIDLLEDLLIQKFKLQYEQNKNMQHIIDSTNNYYYIISTNCMK